MCHIPPGNPSNAHTISVSRNALKGHAKHEDLEGRCDQPSNCRILCNDEDPCTDDSLCSEVKGNPRIRCNPVPVNCGGDGERIREEFREQGSIPDFVLDGFDLALYEMVAAHIQGRSLSVGDIAFLDETVALHGEYGFPLGNTLFIEGQFTPDSMTIAEDTSIRAYTSNGFASESIVNVVTGYFSLGITTSGGLQSFLLSQNHR